MTDEWQACLGTMALRSPAIAGGGTARVSLTSGLRVPGQQKPPYWGAELRASECNTVGGCASDVRDIKGEKLKSSPSLLYKSRHPDSLQVVVYSGHPLRDFSFPPSSGSTVSQRQHE